MERVNLAAAVEAFVPAGRPQLKAIMNAPDFKGVIPAAEATALARQTGQSSDELMLSLVLVARAFAYPPISNYHVGATVRTMAGDLILGGNMEFPGLALNMTVHGEQAAVLYARYLGMTNLDAIAVNGTPCGHCRQFLAEINNPEFTVITPQSGRQPLTDALPNPFMPQALGNHDGALDVQTRQLPYPEGRQSELVLAAHQAAQESHAPYSKNWAGVAVKLADGSILAAPYMENVAFNPSVAPLLSVLVAIRMQQRAWPDIREAVLVEAADSLASQAPACRTLLATLGDVRLQHLII